MSRPLPLVILALGASLASGFGFSTSASAEPGVWEINRTCAVETGCFPGDTAGFPVTITSSGSYRLTGDLTVQSGGSQNLSMIEISAEDVDLDLAGFRIRCASFVVNSECSGSGRGVSSTARGTTLRDGTILGMAADGVYLADDARVVDVSAIDNGGIGIRTGTVSIVRDSVARGNAGQGILTGSAATVRDCIARDNQSTGIQAGNESVLRGNTSASNGSVGISVGGGSSVVGNTASSNGNDGFSLRRSLGSTLDGGIAQSNVAVANVGYGFDNTLSAGGLTLPGSGWGLIDNAARDNNAGGDQIRGGTELGQNLCGTDTICP